MRIVSTEPTHLRELEWLILVKCNHLLDITVLTVRIRPASRALQVLVQVTPVKLPLLCDLGTNISTYHTSTETP